MARVAAGRAGASVGESGGEVDDAGTPSMAPVSAALRDARARVLVYARDGYMYDPRRLAFWTSFLFGFVP